jgi:hypothetical protein
METHSSADERSNVPRSPGGLTAIPPVSRGSQPLRGPRLPHRCAHDRSRWLRRWRSPALVRWACCGRGGLYCRADCVLRSGEHHEEAVAFGAHLPAAARRPCSPLRPSAAVQCLLICAPQPSQQQGRLLDVGEQHRDGLGRKLDHVSIIDRPARDCRSGCRKSPRAVIASPLAGRVPENGPWRDLRHTTRRSHRSSGNHRRTMPVSAS